MTAAEPMDMCAGLLNDTAKSRYTYAVQIPYLNMALSELQQQLQLNQVPYINQANSTSSPITVTTAQTSIGGTGATLPTDFYQPVRLYERTAGSGQSYIQMTEVEFLPPIVTKTTALIYWAFIHNIIQLVGALSNTEVVIQYIANPLATITASTTTIGYSEGGLFLGYRTAALCAQYIMEDTERAQSLNSNAGLSLDIILGIDIKTKQAITTRRRPFRAGYKMGSYGY